MIVADCENCPLFHSDDLSDWCGHPDIDRRDVPVCTGHWEHDPPQPGDAYIRATWPAPDWCPLRVEPFVLAFGGK